MSRGKLVLLTCKSFLGLAGVSLVLLSLEFKSGMAASDGPCADPMEHSSLFCKLLKLLLLLPPILDRTRRRRGLRERCKLVGVLLELAGLVGESVAVARLGVPVGLKVLHTLLSQELFFRDRRPGLRNDAVVLLSSSLLLPT